MDVDFLKNKAKEIRTLTLSSLISAGSGHTAGSLDMADIFATLFFGRIYKYDPQNPDLKDRDILILSNGHICPVLYSTMALSGFFPVEELKTLRKFGSRLQGHPHREFLPGLETSSGPLGSGLSQAVGFALADRLDKKERFVFCLMSDGELDEGNSWEGAMLAGKEKLNKLIAVIDRNKIQIDGNTEDIMPLRPLNKKFESFGFEVIEIDGHDFSEILTGFGKAKKSQNKPVVIIANTIPSKGIKEWEGDYRWHGKPPKTKEEITLVKKYFGEVEIK